jgi:hypothetical protein
MGAYYGHMLRPLPVAQLKSRRFLVLAGKQFWPLIAFTVVVGLSAGPSWIPAETAKIGNSSSLAVIYSLDMKEDQATILNRAEGVVQIVPVDDIHERRTCDDSSAVGPKWASRPLGEFLGRDPGLMKHPSCPSIASKSTDKRPQVTPSVANSSNPSRPMSSPPSTDAGTSPSVGTSESGSPSEPVTSRRP